MKITKLIIMILVAGFATMVNAQNTTIFNGLLQKVMEEEHLSGAVWSIVDMDSIQTGAVGSENLDTKTPLKQDDRVLVGSITKTLLATGILRLVSQGKLELHAPVSRYLPKVDFDNPWEASSPVTIEHLLNHTSGIEDSRFWQVFSTEAKPETPLEHLFSKHSSATLTVRTIPGSRFSYSNMGYAVLGLVIESVTEQPYESYLDHHLLTPLGMVNSTFQFVSQEGAYQDESLAMGHFENKQTQVNVPTFLRPAGQFVTTAEDMALFARFLMSDGLVKGHPFIETHLLHQMGRSNSTEANENGLLAGYRYGLSYRDRYGVVGYFHRGSIIGYSATFYLFPEEQKAFFISFNMDSETADYEKFNRLFIDHMEVHQPSKTQVLDALPQDVQEYVGFYRINPVQFSKFEYLDLLFNSIQLSTEAAGLKVNSIQSEAYRLLPTEGNLFRRQDRVNPSHVLYKNGEDLLLSDGLLTYEKVSPIYLSLHWLSLVFGLLGIFMILIRGIIKLFQKQLFKARGAIVFPFLSVISLVIPIPFLFNQSFLQLGELTLGNVLLAICTGLLPVGMAIGLLKCYKAKTSRIDQVSILAALQWLVVLMLWGVVPFRIWL